MRQILSLSLSEKASKEIKENSKKRGFSSVSAYIKYLYEQDKELISEKELLSAVEEARGDYKQGKTKQAKSLADLV